MTFVTLQGATEPDARSPLLRADLDVEAAVFAINFLRQSKNSPCVWPACSAFLPAVCFFS
jgi:hypothetical protein